MKKLCDICQHKHLTFMPCDKRRVKGRIHILRTECKNLEHQIAQTKRFANGDTKIGGVAMKEVVELRKEYVELKAAMDGIDFNVQQVRSILDEGNR